VKSRCQPPFQEEGTYQVINMQIYKNPPPHVNCGPLPNKIEKKTTYAVAASSPKRHLAPATTACGGIYYSRINKRHVAPATTTLGGRHCSQAVGEQYVPPQPVAADATCRLGELAATGCGGRCHVSLSELAATAQVVIFVNFTLKVVLLDNLLVEVVFFTKNSTVHTKHTNGLRTHRHTYMASNSTTLRTNAQQAAAISTSSDIHTHTHTHTSEAPAHARGRKAESRGGYEV
jgi:hypothetical protein